MTPPQRPTHEAPAAYPEIVLLDRASVSLRIALALGARSGRRWRVHGGTMADYGLLHITAASERLGSDGTMAEADRVELARLLGLDAPVDPEGVSVFDTSEDYIHAIDLAEGRRPRVIPRPHPWDEPSRPGKRLLGRDHGPVEEDISAS